MKLIQSKKENTPQANCKFAWGAVFVLLSFLFIFPLTTSAATITKPTNNLGLVAYWSFNEGTSTIVGDFSGNKNNGIFNNIANPPTVDSGWTNGKFGKALNFDYTDDFVDMGNPQSLQITGSITISAWVKATDFPGGDDNVIVAKSSSGPDTAYKLVATIDNAVRQFYFEITSDGGNLTKAQIYTNTTIVAGKWYHIVGVADVGTPSVHIYLNGVLDDGILNGAPQTSIFNSSINTYIGARSGDFARNWDGTIDEVRIYNRALTASEIAALYNTGSVTHKVPNNLGLVGYWSMNDGTSTVVTDFSGKGNNGTLLTGNVTIPTWTNGKFGQALKFGGTAGFVEVRPSPSLNNLTQFSQSFWLKLDTDVASDRYILRKSPPAGNLGWNISLIANNNRLYFFRVFASGGFEVTSENLPIAGAGWQHFVVVDDGTTIAANQKIYRNGILLSHAGNFDGSGAITDDSGEGYWIGGDNGGAQSADVSMDEVRFYNRMLDADEVNALYQGSKTRFINSSQNTRITNGLVGLWSFNGADVDWLTGTAYDRSGNNNNGTVSGMSTSSSVIGGKVGQALNFNGVNNYVNGGNISGMNGLTKMTASAWVKTNRNGGILTETHIIEKSLCSGGTDTGVFELVAANSGNSHKVHFVVYKSGGTPDVTDSGPSLTSVDDTNWHHVAGVYDGTDVIIYVDGIRESSTGLAGATLSSPSTIFDIGGACGGAFPQLAWPGGIDEARVYNRALSAQEIKQLYLMGK